MEDNQKNNTQTSIKQEDNKQYQVLMKSINQHKDDNSVIASDRKEGQGSKTSFYINSMGKVVLVDHVTRDQGFEHFKNLLTKTTKNYDQVLESSSTSLNLLKFVMLHKNYMGVVHFKDIENMDQEIQDQQGIISLTPFLSLFLVLRYEWSIERKLKVFALTQPLSQWRPFKRYLLYPCITIVPFSFIINLISPLDYSPLFNKYDLRSENSIFREIYKNEILKDLNHD